jgi:hypothetical protein
MRFHKIGRVPGKVQDSTQMSSASVACSFRIARAVRDSLLPRRHGPQSLSQEIDRRANFGGRAPVGGVGVDAIEFDRLVIELQRNQQAGLDLARDEERRLVGDALFRRRLAGDRGRSAAMMAGTMSPSREACRGCKVSLLS